MQQNNDNTTEKTDNKNLYEIQLKISLNNNLQRKYVKYYLSSTNLINYFK